MTVTLSAVHDDAESEEIIATPLRASQEAG
jgi:hypothetical protein